MEEQKDENDPTLTQQFVYVFIYGMDWEDSVIILSKDEAIEISKKYPNSRVEIFGKSKHIEKGLINSFGFTPTYNYYKNGELVLFY
jgi:hypothetical protein